jgi:hypothetical protein
MGWACNTYVVEASVYRALVGKPEGKRTLGRPKLKQNDNIKI